MKCNDYPSAKAFLRRRNELEAEIAAKKDQIETLRTAAVRVTSIINDVKIQRSKSPSLAEEYTAIAMDLEAEVAKDEERLEIVEAEIMRTIQQVADPIYKLILMKRYILDEPWKTISVGKNLSESHKYRIHNAALKEVDDILKDRATLGGDSSRPAGLSEKR